MTPSLSTSTPALARPATTAASRNSPERRGSRPTTATGRPVMPAGRPRTAAEAAPRSMARRAFSSRPATPRTPSVPNSRLRCPASPMSLRSLLSARVRYGSCTLRVLDRLAARHLPLGVLRRLPGLLEPVLLPLLDPGVPGQEAGLLQRRAVLRVHQGQRPGHAEAQRARLPGDAATGDPGHHVELALRAERHERLVDQLLVHLVGEVHVERPAVDEPLARARKDADPGDGLLAAASARGVAGDHRTPGDSPRWSVLCGFCRVLRRDVRAELVVGDVSVVGVVLDAGGRASGLSHGLFLVLPLLDLLLDLRDLVRLRPLRLVRVVRARVHLELAQRLAAERVLGQHAPHGLLHGALGVAGHQAGVRDRPQAARVTGVPVGVLLLEFAARQRHLRRVDHDHEIAGVHVRGEYRLVLAPEQHRHVAGQAAEHHVGSIDDMPLPRDVGVLRAECAHSPKPSRMYRDLLRPAPAGEGRPGTHRGRTAPRERAYGKAPTCMPVAHDANAAYSVSRSDAKATPHPRGRGFTVRCRPATRARESCVSTLTERNRTLLSTYGSPGHRTLSLG